MASAQPISQPSHRGAPVATAQVGSPPSKEQLRSWWNKFGRRKDKPEEQPPPNHGIFGVPLAQSILYANVAISLTNEQGESFIYGYVPIVVAKCGVFLKEKATDVEGIFRLSGSARRINDLQTIFNSPERYGKGLDWTGYTVHDAANILRRYLNQLPEPIVPLDFYEKFRDPLRDYQAKVGSDAQAEAMENQEHAKAVAAYQRLITQLPALNRQLLLYILDLLAVFASKSDLNRMPAQNLAAIFQPGIISHPAHDMAPNQYRLSQDVLIFLIENQDNFLIGMTGTAMDQKTQDEVKSGPPSIVAAKNTIGRSASTASAGSASIRRTGGIRRNASLSSRNSRDRTSPQVSNPATPVSSSGALTSASNTGSLGRSNTVPSNRSPAMVGGRFQGAKLNEIPQPDAIPNTNLGSASVTPAQGEKAANTSTVVPEAAAATDGATVASQAVPSEPRAPAEYVSSTKAPPEMTSSTRAGPTIIETNQEVDESPASTVAAQVLRPTTESTTPTSSINGGKPKERKVSGLMAKSPIFGPALDASRDGNQRQPRKLQKRRIPGANNESAQSSQASLNAEDGPSFHTPLATPSQFHQDRGNPIEGRPSVEGVRAPQQPADASYTSPNHREGRRQGPTLMPPHGSPTPSQQSRGSGTETSDFDALDDPVSRRDRRRNIAQTEQLDPPPPMGQLAGAKASNSSLGSHRPRKSFTGDSQLTQSSNIESIGHPSAMHVSSRESAEILGSGIAEGEKKNFFSRMKAKMSQSKEQREAEKERAKSPPRFQGEPINSRSSLSAFAHEHLSPRGRSFDKPRDEGHGSDKGSMMGHERTGSRNPVPPYYPAAAAAPPTGVQYGPHPGNPQMAAQPMQQVASVQTGPTMAPSTMPYASSTIHTQQSSGVGAAEARPVPEITQKQQPVEAVELPSDSQPGSSVATKDAPVAAPVAAPVTSDNSKADEAVDRMPVTAESQERQHAQVQAQAQVPKSAQPQPTITSDTIREQERKQAIGIVGYPTVDR